MLALKKTQVVVGNYIIACLTMTLFLMPAIAHSQSIAPSMKWFINSEGALPQTHELEEPRYSSFSSTHTQDRQMLGYVKVGIDKDVHKCYSGYRKYKVTVEITYEEMTAFNTGTYTPTFTTSSPVTRDFIVEVNPDCSDPHRESAIYFFKNAYFVSAVISDVEVVDSVGTPVTITTMPDDLPDALYLETVLDAELYKEFDPETAPVDLSVYYIDLSGTASGTGLTYANPNDYKNSVVFKWDAATNGETDLELEWTYVSDYDPGLSAEYLDEQPEEDLYFTFTDNATRVRLPASATEYVIPAMYDRGWIVARIRGVGRDFDNLDNEIRSVWSLPQAVNDTTHLDNTLTIGAAMCHVAWDDSSSVNWISSATFAEEGKNKFVVSYADGTSRVRQQVTLSSTEHIAIATESFYDHQGRAVVQSLPAPVLARGDGGDNYVNHIRYFPNLNRNTSHQKYSRADFDMDPGNDDCFSDIGPFSDATGGTAMRRFGGSGRYYSDLNQIQDGAQAFVPQSGGYPFTVTQFTPDNTGRIARQSGVGPTHKIGSGHETQYFYSTPGQVELDRLFGTDVGFKNYYQKTMVVDANGQVSVSYTDMAGRTIATSLAGEAPDNVQDLKTPAGVSIPGDDPADITEDLIGKTLDVPLGLNTVLSDDSLSLSINYGIVVSSGQVYNFDYNVEAEAYTSECLTDICFNCRYTLSISVKDRCGKEMLDGGAFSMSVGGGEVDTTCSEENVTSGPQELATISLPVGEYTVIKTLTVDNKSLYDYVDVYMRNSTCLKTFDDFYSEPDTLDCNMTCLSCSTRLANMGETLEDYLIAQGGGELSGEDVITYTDYYNSVKALCDELCQVPSLDNCDALLQTMLADMGPGGQYGAFEPDASIPEMPDMLIATEPLSIYNINNSLPYRNQTQFFDNTIGGTVPADAHFNFAPVGSSNVLPSWHKPAYYLGDGKFAHEYRDEDNNRPTILVNPNLDGTYSPAVVNPAEVVYDAVNDLHYTYPENLANLSDFVEVFQPSFAKSLIVYHPEFFAYQWCTDRVYDTHTDTYNGVSATLNSNQFDYYLSNLTLAQAITDFGSGLDIAANDPLFANYSALNTDIDAKTANFLTIGGTDYNIFQAAIISKHLTGNFTNDATDILAYFTTAHSCSTNVACTSAIITTDDEWKAVVEYYLSAKQKVILEQQLGYAMLTPIFSCYSCIGSSSMLPCGTSAYSPCRSSTAALYVDKTPRVYNFTNSTNDVLGVGDVDMTNPDDAQAIADYKYWEQTGKCPRARDVEAFLIALVGNNKLLTGSTLDLASGAYLSHDLFDLFGGADTPPVALDYLPAVTTNLKTLTWTPAASDELTTCSTPLTLTVPPGLPAYATLDNITHIFDIHDINWTGTYSSFKIRFYVTNPGTGLPELYALDGKVCFDLETCSPGINTCQPTVQAKSLLNLMNALSADGHLDNTGGYALGSTYEPYIGAELRTLLGPGALYWKYDSPDFKLYVPGSGNPVISINVASTTGGISYASPALFLKIFRDGSIISGSAGTENAFKINYLQAYTPTPGVIYNTNNITPTGYMQGTITYTNGSATLDLPVIECGEPTPVACSNPENKNLEQLFDLINLAVFADTINDNLEGVTCLNNLLLESTGEPIDFGIVDAITNVEPDMALSYDGINSYYFKARIVVGEGIDYITGQYCHPIRSCSLNCATPCEPADSLTLTFVFTEPDLESAEGKYIVIPRLNNGCVNIGYADTLFYDEVEMDSDEFLDSLTTLINANPYAFASRDGLTITVTLPTSALSPGCSCSSGINVLIRAVDASDGEKPLSSATIACCKEPAEPEGCMATLTTLLNAYNAALDALQDDFNNDFDTWLSGCAGSTAPECSDDLETLYDAYDSGKAAIEETYADDIAAAKAACPGWQGNPFAYERCNEVIMPFPPGQPFVNTCAQDLMALDTANANYAYNSYLQAVRDSMYVVLRRHCITAANETFTMDYGLKEYHYTLYYYDQAGNLYRTVPPNAVTPITDGGDLALVAYRRLHGGGTPLYPAHADVLEDANLLVTEYRFNSIKQPVEQKTPDGGITSFWYDNLGRLIYTQDSKQRLNDKYSYTKFDWQSRVIERGQIENTIMFTQDISSNPENLEIWESSSTNNEQVIKTYYDTPIIAFSSAKNLRKRVTAILYFDDPDDLAKSGTAYSYDIRGNIKQLLQYNADMPEDHQIKTMYYYYDLISGKVNGIAYQPEGKDRFFHKYKYDADNRLTGVYTWEGADWATIGFDDTDWGAPVMPISGLEHVFPFDEDARNFYYHHGPMSRTELGDLKVQGTDYVYTLQGWIKGVNSVALKTNLDPGLDGHVDGGNTNQYVATDAFSYGLTYFANDYDAIDDSRDNFRGATHASGFGNFTYLYNGNIAAMTTTLRQLNDNVNAYPQGMKYNYDQLNRIVDAKAYRNFSRGDNEWHAESPAADYYNAFTYDANGNILGQLRNGPTTPNVDLDSLQYFYYPGTNQLAYVNDNVSSGNYADDIDDQGAGNYTYDAIGNMIGDVVGDISNIDWTVYGKIKFIDKGTGDDITFTYSPDGNRVSKLTNTRNTYYVRDASGNIMATYTLVADCFTLNEHTLYGYSRIGVRQREICLDDEEIPEEDTEDIVYVWRGYKKYELNNFLNNVLTVVTDRRTAICDGEDVYYEADVISVSDFYPFGSPMVGRTDNQEGYRFGFNGKENDNETYGTGNALDFGARIYDSRLGRWLSRDPLEFKYASQSTYSSFNNNPIWFIDNTGKGGDLGNIQKGNDGNYTADLTFNYTLIVNGTPAQVQQTRDLILASQGFGEGVRRDVGTYNATMGVLNADILNGNQKTHTKVYTRIIVTYTVVSADDVKESIEKETNPANNYIYLIDQGNPGEYNILGSNQGIMNISSLSHPDFGKILTHIGWHSACAVYSEQNYEHGSHNDDENSIMFGKLSALAAGNLTQHDFDALCSEEEQRRVNYNQKSYDHVGSVGSPSIGVITNANGRPLEHVNIGKRLINKMYSPSEVHSIWQNQGIEQVSAAHQQDVKEIK